MHMLLLTKMQRLLLNSIDISTSLSGGKALQQPSAVLCLLKH
jgi:hypothetical protein